MQFRNKMKVVAASDINVLNHEASTSAKSTPTGMSATPFHQVLLQKRAHDEMTMSIDELIGEDCNEKLTETILVSNLSDK